MPIVLTKKSKTRLEPSTGIADQSIVSVLQQDDFGHPHELQITRAREAAEALFAPKPWDEQPPAAREASVGSLARKPRVLPVELVPSKEEQVRSSIERGPRGNIPAAHFGRVRVWLTYGMSVAEVAAIYGVPVEHVERILQSKAR